MHWKVYTVKRHKRVMAKNCGTTQAVVPLNAMETLASAKEFDFQGLTINHTVWIPKTKGGSCWQFQQCLTETFWELSITFWMLRQVKHRLIGCGGRGEESWIFFYRFKWINLSGSGDKERALVILVLWNRQWMTLPMPKSNTAGMRSSRASNNVKCRERVKNYFL